MILVCVGMSEDPFDRLLEIIDDFCEKGIIEDEVVAQIGNTKYVPRNYDFFDCVENDKFLEWIKKADLIISHAGIGCVLPALKLGKKVIIFPRKYEHHEHVDNHQVEMLKAFTRKGYVLGATNDKDLQEAINKSKEFVPNKYVSNNSSINNIIIDFIERM